MNNLAVKIEPQRQLMLEHFTPCRLANLAYSVNKSIATIYGSRFGLSTPEWRVLAILGRYPGISAVEVAERTLLDKVAVSRAVTKLVRNGRVDRKFADVDRRRSILNLSNEGSQLLDEIAPLVLDFEDRLLGGLSDFELATFHQVLDKLLVKARHACD